MSTIDTAYFLALGEVISFIEHVRRQPGDAVKVLESLNTAAAALKQIRDAFQRDALSTRAST